MNEATEFDPTRQGSKWTRCKDCGAVWTSVRECHCTNCHQSFAGERAFTMHQSYGGRGRNVSMKCVTDQLIKEGYEPVPRDAPRIPLWSKRDRVV